MATKKISDLTELTTATGSEEFLINDSGTSKKITKNNLLKDVTTNLSLGDNVKAQFGAGNDLQIYHDGSNSVIKETGTGNLYITTDGAEIRLAPYGANENGLRVLQDGAVLAYYDNSTKLATTSTGIDVTGSVTCDGATVGNGNAGTPSTGYQLRISSSATSNYDLGRDTIDGLFKFYGNQTGFTGYAFGGIDGERLRIDSSGNVGIGTSSPDRSLVVNHTTDARVKLQVNGTDKAQIQTVSNEARYHALGNTTSLGLWTNGSEKMRITSSGNVGIGTTSINNKLTLADTADCGIQLTKTGSISVRVAAVGGGMAFGVDGSSGNTERMRIDSSTGNVGIGTDNPSQSLHVDSGNAIIKSAYDAMGTTRSYLYIATRSSGNWRNAYIGQSGGDLVFGNGGTGTDHTNGTERMRIDSTGNLLVGKTSADGGDTKGFELRGASGTLYIKPNTTARIFQTQSYTTANQYHHAFENNSGTLVGNITVTTTATQYNTSSDYRLKENVVPMSGSIDRVKALKPCSFNFIADATTTVDGFLAHEAQAVVPEAVSGEKDAMTTEEYEVTPAVEATYDEEGNELTPAIEAVMGTREVEDYQGIDQSKLTPLIVGALQEAIEKIESLEAEIALLKGA